jgi:hypothetical protein
MNVTPSLHQNIYTTIRIAIYCNTLQQNGKILQYSFCCIVTPLTYTKQIFLFSTELLNQLFIYCKMT